MSGNARKKFLENLHCQKNNYECRMKFKPKLAVLTWISYTGEKFILRPRSFFSQYL